ncbi:hypothetical protein FIBSPDRAFT_339456 [Athelia psychrophila]|uniref:Uncharacterized protein n=1 Tax=Athelia psychrophila TaxID=1759441 RepID=A0A167W8V8_9AGAM|nr:hypothetical protein FIBSPDRAFT_339456 [Fibularhizoctonia sp. CBS 109695]
MSWFTPRSFQPLLHPSSTPGFICASPLYLPSISYTFLTTMHPFLPTHTAAQMCNSLTPHPRIVFFLSLSFYYYLVAFVCVLLSHMSAR